MLESTAKYIKRRREHGCSFIKKEEHEYIVGKSISPYKKRSSFFITGSQNCMFYPKIAIKSTATVVFGRKMP